MDETEAEIHAQSKMLLLVNGMKHIAWYTFITQVNHNIFSEIAVDV